MTDRSNQSNSKITQIKQQEYIKNEFSTILMFYPMGLEGERLKDQEVKRVVDIWGLNIKNMFYDQDFETLVAVVRLENFILISREKEAKL
jgi:hypothetical protein